MEEQKTFEDLKLTRQFLNAIDDMGFRKPTEIQQKVIPLLTSGKDVIGIAPTGTGKTAAFTLPLLMQLKYAQGDRVRTLIFAPSKELAIQIFQDIESFSTYTDLRSACIYGGVGAKAQIEKIKSGLDILVATPGRFMDLYLQGAIDVKGVKFMVLDEADKLMDMGFMPQLRQILEVVPVKRRNLLFSATFSPKVEELSHEFLEYPEKVEVAPQATTVDTIDQYYVQVPNFKTKLNLITHYLKQDAFSRVIIFVNKKDTADIIFRYFDRQLQGRVRVIHSNKGQNSRINSINEFQDGDVDVLVTTDVSARGIDIDDVTHVINFEVPKAYIDYVHRVGRTGRAGKKGIAYTLVNRAEVLHLKKVEVLIQKEITESFIPDEVEVLETKKTEFIEIERQIDKYKRKENPDFKGAFHEKKKRFFEDPNKKKAREGKSRSKGQRKRRH
ncbi:DEAD/DEAH box helicase [Cyclobacteriaceae bacterium]|nr:DEAD/DEAH box helicase [Cyclobacteriaceae bacterium]